MKHSRGFVACAISALTLTACPRYGPAPPEGRPDPRATAPTTRVVAGYPSSVLAGASPVACQAFEPLLPKPLSDDEVLAQFVGVAATRHWRECRDGDFHPCDPVGPNDCRATPAWDKTWSSPLQRKDLVVFQRYWTLLSGSDAAMQCRFVGEVRLVESRCKPPAAASNGEEKMDVIGLPNLVDLVTAEPLRGEARSAAGTTNHWRP